jgi:hypothetical protein
MLVVRLLLEKGASVHRVFGADCKTPLLKAAA